MAIKANLIWRAIEFIARLIFGAVQRERAAQQRGRLEALKEANDAVIKRREAAEKAAADWRALPDAERERLRSERGHYRD